MSQGLPPAALFISVPYETKPRVHPAVIAIDNLIILTDIHYNAFVIVHLLHSIHYIAFITLNSCWCINNITFITRHSLCCIHYIEFITLHAFHFIACAIKRNQAIERE